MSAAHGEETAVGEAWRLMLEKACRESLREIAHNTLDPATGDGGGGQSVDSIVRKVAERVLAEGGPDLHIGTKSPAASVAIREEEPKPLLADVESVSWMVWRESRDVPNISGSDNHPDPECGLIHGCKKLQASRLAYCDPDREVDSVSEATTTDPDDKSMPEEDSRSRPSTTVSTDDEEMWHCLRRRAYTSNLFTKASKTDSNPGDKCSVVRNGLTIEAYTAQQLVMHWQGRPRTVLLVVKSGDRLILARLKDMAAWLSSQGIVVVLEPQLLAESPHIKRSIAGARTFSPADRLERSIDFVITIGGDGTLTWAVSLFRGPMPPIISFAAGSLGFLTPFPLDNWVRTLTRLLDLHHGCSMPLPLVCRMRLHVTVHRRGGDSEVHQEDQPVQVQCLNEVLVHRGQSGALAKLDVGVDGERITLVQGDGLILATPTGSTAYSLAAGGSMVHPAVPAILLTPVSPHSLSFRPVLLPDSANITVGIPLNARCGAALSVDGKDICTLRIGDSVEVARSPHPVPTICHTTETKDWFASVNKALQWNGRVEQKPE